MNGNTMAIDHILSPQDSCDKILHVIKYSNLNFAIHETPYSVYLTIRKKFIKEAPMKVLNPDSIEQEFSRLKNAISSLTGDLQEEIDNHTESQNLIKILEEKLEHAESEVIKQSKRFQTDKENLEVEAKQLKANAKSVNEESTKKHLELLEELKATKAKENKVSNLENKQRKLEEKINELNVENKKLKVANDKNQKVQSNLENELEQLKT